MAHLTSSLYSIILRVLRIIFDRSTLYRFGRKLYLTMRSEVDNQLGMNGEKFVQYHVLKNCQDNKTTFSVLDIGANVGEWSDSFIDIALTFGNYKHLSLHVFEPVPRTFEMLSERLSSKEGLIGSIKYNDVAVSSVAGQAEMYVVGDGAGTNSFHKDYTGEYVENTEVNTITIDSYLELNEIDSVAMIKCDTEGHDMEVIIGAKKSLKAGKIKVLQFEYNHRWIFSRHYLKDAFDLVIGKPYKIAKILPNGIEVYSGWHPELEKFFEGNYLFIHEKALNWFPSNEVLFDNHNAMVAV